MAESVGLDLDGAQRLVLESAQAEAADGSWLADQVALVEPRQNGKTAILSARGLTGALMFREELIVWTAHRLSTALEGFRTMRSLVTDYDHVRRQVKGRPHRTTFGTGEIEFRNGCRILFLARAAGASGRGASASTLFLDEAFDLNDDDLAALLPALSAKPNHQVWYTSSAPKRHSAVLRRICKAGRAGSPGLAYLEWSATDEDDSEDREAWRRANPAFGVRITEQTILGELAQMSDEDFRRERLGIWREDDDDAWEVVPERPWLERCDPNSLIAEDARGGLAVAFAVDIDPEREMGTIGVCGLRADGREHVEVIERRRGTSWLVERLMELAGKYRMVSLAVVKGGAAASHIGALERANLPVWAVNEPEYARACGEFFEAFTEGDAVHRGQQSLNAAVGGGAKRESPEGGWRWARDVTADPGLAVVCTLALAARRRTKPVPRSKVW